MTKEQKPLGHIDNGYIFVPTQSGQQRLLTISPLWLGIRIVHWVGITCKQKRSV